ncbi:MAG TPA: hypothetical protein VET69_01150 [Terriglobales bacterium]|nr:hypothetical protein [Terriglobales bacterium]
MKRYWHFVLVGVICLLVALLWAQPQSSQTPASQAVRVALPDAPVQQSSNTTSASKPAAPAQDHRNAESDDDPPLPGSSSSLPLLAVIGFGVLAGGITSAMRTR